MLCPSAILMSTESVVNVLFDKRCSLNFGATTEKTILTKFADFKKISGRVVGQFGCGTRIMRGYSQEGLSVPPFTCMAG